MLTVPPLASGAVSMLNRSLYGAELAGLHPRKLRQSCPDPAPKSILKLAVDAAAAVQIKVEIPIARTTFATVLAGVD